MNDKINIKVIDDWTAKTISASGSDEVEFDLDILNPVGFMSLQISITGTGTLKITHQSSNDGVIYSVAEGASDILTAMTTGDAFIVFDAPFARWIKLKVEETGGANSVVITKTILAIQ